MAIAVTQGHVQRAIEFYNKLGKYFILGGTSPWEDEVSPPAPSIDDYKLFDNVGLKRVDNCHLVIPDESGTISYRTQNWKIVPLPYRTTISGSGLVSGATVLTVASLAGFSIGAKVRVNSTYVGKVVSINNSANQLTLDTPAPQTIPSGSTVEGGALVEGAKYVYIDCYLNYDQFPIVTYRQIGLCTEVTPNTENVLRAAAYSPTGTDEYTSTGILEVLDNRPPSTRDIDQRELLSLILEF